MKKVGIFFGSSSGTTEDIAGRIAGKLGVSGADIYNVGSVEAGAVQNYDVLLLGSSTWGAGDLQDDWYDFLPKLRKEDLSGKLVALFGCGEYLGKIHDIRHPASLSQIIQKRFQRNVVFHLSFHALTFLQNIRRCII